MDTAQILRAAARRVRQGWCQHGMYDFATAPAGICALGALSLAASDEDNLGTVYGCVVDALGLQRNTTSIAQWNDAPGQTAEGVATGLEYAALVWEQERAQHTAQLDEVCV